MKGLPKIDGWEYTGEWRHAKGGEGFIGCDNVFCVWTGTFPTEGCHPILHRKRWRAESGEHYYFLNPRLEVIVGIDWVFREDDARYQVGNYFQTEEEAKQARERVLKALKGE